MKSLQERIKEDNKSKKKLFWILYLLLCILPWIVYYYFELNLFISILSITYCFVTASILGSIHSKLYLNNNDFPL